MKAMALLGAVGAAAGCAGVLALIGAAGIWAGEPWLIASLGASILVQLAAPRLAAARPWNTAAGQLIGLAAGFAGVYAVGAASMPPVSVGAPFTWTRIAATALAIALTVLGQRALKATNPAGGSTCLLIALGKIAPSAHGAWVVAAGILLVTVLGEPLRFAVLRLEREPG